MADQNWEERYIKGETEWEKGEPSPGLVDFLAAGKLHPPAAVLVPGCGTGHDVRAFAKTGFDATGLDIAPTAIRLAGEKSAAASLKADFRVGNFLADEPFRRFDLLFEHTLFCAINPQLRDNYVQSVRRWLKPNGLYLAVFYMLPPEDEGPPFGTTREEIRRRFDPFFLLREDWVPRSYPNRTGLEWMTFWMARA